MNLCNEGHHLTRQKLPEAAFVYNEKYFTRERREFTWFAGFVGVSGQLAKILKQADFGPEGGLVPIPVYEADKETLYSNDFYLLNWGKFKANSFVPEKTTGFKQLLTQKQHGQELWIRRSYEPLDIALKRSALPAADMWIEPRVDSMMFLKDKLAQEILTADIEPDLMLTPCRVVEG